MIRESDGGMPTQLFVTTPIEMRRLKSLIATPFGFKNVFDFFEPVGSLALRL
jgi:hypothetical protein